MKAYLFDYADVISYAQNPQLIAQMACLLGLEGSKFHHQYWKFRRPYDLGDLKGKDYWPLVAQRELRENELSELIELDCRSWFEINPDTIEILKRLKSKGKKLALLSNLPLELVNYLRQKSQWLTLFDEVFFSAEIRKVKPEKETYQYVLNKLNLKAPQVIFFDDKPENLQAASQLGMQTYLINPDSIKVLLNTDFLDALR